MNACELRAEVARLSPWHLNVEITPEVTTATFLDEPMPEEKADLNVSFIDARSGWIDLIGSLYPDGLGDRSVLDCACNCGAYSFWMKEMGAAACLGFDVREHWIEQARFLKRARSKPSDGLSFEVCDLYDSPKLAAGAEFDISIFKGILYHLPDPVHGLQLVADRTRELLIINTAARSDLPDGMLAVAQESVEHPMSGVHGLSWFPTGPEVVTRIVSSLGFPASRCTFWKRAGAGQRDGLGRLEVICARDERTFENFDARRKDRRIAADRSAKNGPHDASVTR